MLKEAEFFSEFPYPLPPQQITSFFLAFDRTGVGLALYQWCWLIFLAWMFSFFIATVLFEMLIPTDLLVYCLTIYHSVIRRLARLRPCSL